MVKVYFSHMGNPLLKGINELEVNEGTVLEVINQINRKVLGIRDCILSDNNKILSSARLFKNIDVYENEYGAVNYYEKDDTIEIKNVEDEKIVNGENLLISLFEPQYLKALLNKALAESTDVFKYTDMNGATNSEKYKPIISAIDGEVIREEIKEFKLGQTTLESLKVKKNEQPFIKINNKEFDKKGSKLLPEELVNAIKDIWGIEDEAQGRLRLFQEDSLFFIMSKLLHNDYPTEDHLLLSMPTGGGKTEAFMIPIVSNIFLKKQIQSNTEGVKAIIIYPTNALANDQAMRFVELIYKLNSELKRQFVPKSKHISIGILSGDTPISNSNLESSSLIQICPKCGNSEFKKEDNTLKCKAIVDGKICNTSLEFCRLTKNDIVNNPPDILITNPDEINFALHSPKYAQIFYNSIETIVFDELHMYQGIFGCHIAQLLRRLEEISNHKPLYIGLSATIGNAKQLAALLFNENLNNIKYIHNKNNDYTTEKTIKYRYHYLIKPALIKKGTKNERYVRTLSVAGVIGMFIGHLLTDSHFRKTIIFANYRNDADDLAKYLREREELDIQYYFRQIINKLNRNEKLDKEEVDICTFIHKWVSVLIADTVPNKDVLEIGWNRGGLEKETRIRSIHSFVSNKRIGKNINSENTYSHTVEKPIDLMVATKTLEVGIDIGDVSTVINSSAPFTTNEYTQRVGRAGRKKDSIAITVINPENGIDAYFSKYFRRYVGGKDFEDAPIIISNEIIVKRHIIARILDYFTKRICQLEEYKNFVTIYISTLKQVLKVKHRGRILEINENTSNLEAKEFAEAIYNEIFNRKLYNNKTVINNYLDFLAKEADVLGFNNSEITEEFIKNIIIDKLLEISKHLRKDSNQKWENSECISGFNSKDPSLTPKLRGSGETVDLYLEGVSTDRPKDTVSRQRAFNNMPPSSVAKATASSGISTFEIKGANMETDVTAEKLIRKKISKDRDCITYFGNKLEGFPVIYDSEDFLCEFNVRVPKKLFVRYFPNRFYCSKCEKGLIPPNDIIENESGILCRKCLSKVQQLPLVYLCTNEECGHLMEPPVPKTCINPECTDFNKFYNDYKNNNFKFNYEMIKHFRFRLTKDLEWVCKTCGTKMSFNSIKNMIINNPNKKELKQVIDNWNEENTKLGIAVRMKKKPEYFYNGQYNTSHFSCDKNRSHHKHITVVGIPRVRTVSANYFGKGVQVLKPTKEFFNKNGDYRIGIIEFTNGYSIQLSNKFYRRYTSGNSERNTVLKYDDIFEDNLFLGNYFETHFAWIKFGDSIEKFLDKGIGLYCDLKCDECNMINKLDLGKIMAPKLYIEPFNWDKATDKPRKPDPREKYCDKALRNECNKISCNTCADLKRDKFIRYLIIHTLKHGIIWALPKYAGVNVSEIRGEVYPNDRKDGTDILLYDSNEGGSGAILLIEKHWDKIWNFAVEIIKETYNNNANIILPYTCSRYNSDLCPYITNKYLEFIGY